MSEEAEIINIAVNIFQNVGIKRWIDQIEALRNEQIYMQICKIISPETMIKLFKINESNLTTGEKIQEVIQMIAHNIKLDLYHISGQAIAEGNLNHLRNLLQLLEALSNTFITTSRQDVHTAPEKDTNQSDSIEHGHYTVLGIPKEFQNKHIDDDDHMIGNSHRKDRHSSNRHQDSHRKNYNEDWNNHGRDEFQDYQEEVQLKPKGPIQYSDRKLTRKQDKKVRFKDSTHHSVKRKKSKNQQEIDQIYTNDTTNRSAKGYSRPSQFRKNDIVYTKKVNYIQRIGTIIEELEKKKIYDESYLYKAWKHTKKQSHLRVKRQIEGQSGERGRVIDREISEREKVVNALKGQEGAVRNIVKVFKQERKLYRDINREKLSRQMELLDQLVNQGDNESAKLQQAILSSLVNVGKTRDQH